MFFLFLIVFVFIVLSQVFLFVIVVHVFLVCYCVLLFVLLFIFILFVWLLSCLLFFVVFSLFLFACSCFFLKLINHHNNRTFGAKHDTYVFFRIDWSLRHPNVITRYQPPSPDAHHHHRCTSPSPCTSVTTPDVHHHHRCTSPSPIYITITRCNNII